MTDWSSALHATRTDSRVHSIRCCDDRTSRGLRRNLKRALCVVAHDRNNLLLTRLFNSLRNRRAHQLKSTSAAKTSILHLGRLASKTPDLLENNFVLRAFLISTVSFHNVSLFMGISKDSELHMASNNKKEQNHSEQQREQTS